MTAKIDPPALVMALELLRLGFWPVALTPPGGPKGKAGGKRPIEKNWGKVRPTEARLRDLWRKYPQASVGLRLGREGKIVDFDCDGPGGEESLGKLLGGEEIATMGIASKRGPHAFYAWDERLAEFPSLVKDESLFPGLEIRFGSPSAADGKQFQSVFAPSPTTWEEGDRIVVGAPRVHNGIFEVSPLPDAFFDRLRTKLAKKKSRDKRPASVPTRPKADGVDLSADDRWAQAALVAEVAKLGSTELDRNSQLNKSAFALGQLIPRYLARSSVEGSLRAEAERIGLGLGEIEATIRSGIEAGMDEPRTRPERPESMAGRPRHDADGSGAGGEDQGDERGQPAADRPEILIQTNELVVNDQAVQALRSDPEIYHRGCCLVTVRRDQKKNPFVERIEQTPWIAVVPRPTLRERMSNAACWIRLRALPNSSEMNKVPVHPPDWAVAAVESRGAWDGLRHLEGVVEAPALLADGSILDKPGYDERSGLLYEPNYDFPPIPRRITQADAKRAADEVLEVVADFPFAVIGEGSGDGGAGHRAAYLASLLTPLARYAIAGPCPLFLTDANVSGAGKSKLCDIVAILATGREAARTSYPEADEEMRKQILSIAIEGDRLVLIDNVKTGAALGGAALDAVLTATTVKGRILGKTEMSREMPIYTVWFATGNNLALKGDLLRRVVPCRLDSPYERPEENTDFRIKGDLIAHVKANRGRLVVAALTILRGYFLAGRPQADLISMDYPAWCGVVRQAVFWATGIDPCCTRQELIVDDPETNQLRAVVSGWSELPRGTVGLTTAEAVRILKNPENHDRFNTLRDALLEWSRDGEIPSPKMIGKRLKEIKDRVINGMVVISKPYQGIQIWAAVESKTVKFCGSGGSGGSGGSVHSFAGELFPHQKGDGEGEYLMKNDENKPTTPTTPTNNDKSGLGDAYEGDLS